MSRFAPSRVCRTSVVGDGNSQRERTNHVWNSWVQRSGMCRVITQHMVTAGTLAYWRDGIGGFVPIRVMSVYADEHGDTYARYRTTGGAVGWESSARIGDAIVSRKATRMRQGTRVVLGATIGVPDEYVRQDV